MTGPGRMYARSSTTLDDPGKPMDTWRHGSARPLPAVGSPGRGAALPADERRVLLPLRAHRALGPDAAGDAGVPLVSRGHLGPALARDRGRRAGLDPARRPRARAARGGPRPAQRTGSSCAGDSPARA